ncbi:hypothetical protein [Streptomyces sp. NPDC006997]|uniref:hypothetical protein n=1 Tax=Streptomyces sp. NPDC006997 TaxID=3155356 RepID=UPI0033C0A834
MGPSTDVTPGSSRTAPTTRSTVWTYSSSLTVKVSESKTITSCSAPAVGKSDSSSWETCWESEPVTL